MTTATLTHRPAHVAHRVTSKRLAIDPYRIEDFAWTRAEILRARHLPTRTASTTRKGDAR
jgi:hypothetical protein